MTLNWQNVPVNLAVGIDTKTDDFALNAKLQSAANAILTNPGGIAKRPGYVETIGPGAIGRGVFAYESETLVHADEALFGYAGGAWRNRGELHALRTSDIDVGDPGNIDAANFVGAQGGDTAASGQYTVYAWLNNADAYVTVYDRTAASFVLGATKLNGTNGVSQVRCVAIGTKIAVVYNDGGATHPVTMRAWDPATPTVFAAGIVLYSDATFQTFTAEVYNGTSAALAVAITGGIIKSGRFDTTGITVAMTASTASNIVNGNVHILVTAAGKVCVFAASTTGPWFGVWAAAGTFTGLAVIDTGVSTSRITAIFNGTNITVSYMATTGLKRCLVTDAPTVLVSQQVILPFTSGAALIVGHAFQIGTNYVVAITYLSSMFFVNVDTGVCVAKALIDRASSSATPNSVIARPVMVDATHMLFAVSRQIDIIGSLSQASFQLCGVLLDLAPRPSSTRVGSALVIASGQLMQYDGVHLLEQGFVHEPVVSLATASTGGSLSNGAYALQAIYVWHDANGQKHRSPASDKQAITLSGGTATQTITATISTYRMSAKTNVTVELYRTIAGGDSFLFVGRINNDPTAATVAITATASDATIGSNAEIYTDAEVAAVSTRSPLFLGAAHDRVFAYVGNGTFYVSKPRTVGIGLTFADEITKQMTVVRNPIAVIGMDEKTVVLATDGLAYFTGDGPDSQGNGVFSADALITADVGLVDPSSVVATADGIEFRTAKGLYLLDRGLNVQYFGSPAEQYNAETVVGAVLAATRNQVKFALAGANDPILVYDYFLRQWVTESSVRTLQHAAIVGVGATAATVLLDTASNTHRQTDGIWQDAGAAYALNLRTSWIQPADLQGYQRTRRATLLARKLSDCRITVKVHYDYVYDGPLSETFTFDSAAAAIANNSVWQIRTDKLAHMKCEAIAFDIIEDLTAGYAAGPALAVQQLMLEVGVKKGVKRLGIDRTMTRS